MRFPDETRKTIYDAKGKAVEIDWPKGQDEPQVGHRYSVQASHHAGERHVRVLFRDEVDDYRWRALVVVDADPVRPLRMKAHKDVEPDPTTGPQFRPEYEPERVSKVDEDELTRRARAAHRSIVQREIGDLEDRLQQLRQVPELQCVGSNLKFIESLLRKAEKVALGGATA